MFEVHHQLVIFCEIGHKQKNVKKPPEIPKISLHKFDFQRQKRLNYLISTPNELCLPTIKTSYIYIIQGSGS